MSAIEKDSRFALQHTIHTYERSKNNKEIYRCKYPRCSHYTNRQFLEGKEAECPKCKNSFILTWRHLRNKLPVCEFCSKSPKSRELRRARDIAFQALNDLPDEIKQSLLDTTLEE